MHTLDLLIDVSEAAGLGETATVALTVQLPEAERLGDPAIVCFGKPGGGYSRHYYTCDLPGPARGAQSDWHVERGWIFVSVDHLGVGESSLHAPESLTYQVVAAASQAAEEEVLRRLEQGSLLAGYPSVIDPVKIGIGQSMGGCMTIIQQGRYHLYDGVATLGYSAIHNSPMRMPGADPIIPGWTPRDLLLSTEPRVFLNAPHLAEAAGGAVKGAGKAMAWGFFWDDVDPAIIDADLNRFENMHAPAAQDRTPPPKWGSLTTPGAVARTCNTPGVVAPEAAAIIVPVLCAMGQRDCIDQPKREAQAFVSSNSVDLFICPQMGHMHNFASTRVLFWRRLELWVDWVVEAKASSPKSALTTWPR